MSKGRPSAFTSVFTLEIRVMMQIGDISPEILDLHSSCLFPWGKNSVENIFQIHSMK